MTTMTMRELIADTIRTELDRQFTHPQHAQAPDFERVATKCLSVIKVALVTNPEEAFDILDWTAHRSITLTEYAALPAFIVLPPALPGVRCSICDHTYTDLPIRMTRTPNTNTWTHQGCAADQQHEHNRDQQDNPA